MLRIYKNKNPNVRRMSFLFVFQVVLGIIPAVLFSVYALSLKERNVWLGIVFISVILFSFAGYIVAGQRYNVLISGYRGERSLIRTVKKLGGNYSVFTNLQIRYKKNRSEIDLLIIGENGLLIIEVKNHSGVIIGKSSDETWIQRKYYRNGKTAEIIMYNPFTQIKRQREILKNILRANGFDVWVDCVLFFSGMASLRLNLSGNDNVVNSENELIGFINGYKSKTPLTEEDVSRITDVLKDFKI